MSNGTWFWLSVLGVAIALTVYRTLRDAPLPGETTMVSGLDALAKAIAFAEGYGADPGNRPTRSNNPGDLTADGMIRTFPTADDGWAALKAQLQLIADGRSQVYDPNMTIGDIARSWTTTEQQAWASNVVAYLKASGYDGATVDTPFNAIVSV